MQITPIAKNIATTSSAITMLIGTGTAFASMLGLAVAWAPSIATMMG